LAASAFWLVVVTFVDRQNGHVVAACDGSGAVAISIIALLPAG
jgi:hypothetical protein